MMSYTYSVKVRSGHHIPGALEQYLKLRERGDAAGENPHLHKFATYLWGGGGLLFYDTVDQHEAFSPVEKVGPRSQVLTIHVDVDGCPIELYAATLSAVSLDYPNPKTPGLYYLGQLRPGQVAGFRLNLLHGIAAVCNDPSGSDSKVTCVLMIDPAETTRPVA